jgi:hypothetical protein
MPGRAGEPDSAGRGRPGRERRNTGRPPRPSAVAGPRCERALHPLGRPHEQSGSTPALTLRPCASGRLRFDGERYRPSSGASWGWSPRGSLARGSRSRDFGLSYLIPSLRRVLRAGRGSVRAASEADASASRDRRDPTGGAGTRCSRPGASLAMETRRQRCGCQRRRPSLDEGERFAIPVRVVPLHEQGDLIHGQCDPRTKGQAQPELAPITARHDRRAPVAKASPMPGRK